MSDIQKAIEWQKAFKKNYNGVPEEVNNMCDLAIYALEKQIPQVPDYEGDGYADGELVYDMAYCPVCGHEFEYGINDWGSAYCSDCGQAIDWGE